MIKRIGGIFLLSVSSLLAFGQENNEPAPTQPESAKPTRIRPGDPKTVRPDFPGIITLELGFNRDLSGPSAFSPGFFGSRTANIYYQYEMRLFKSQFSVVPGIGLSLERFQFKNDYVLGYTTSAKDQVTLIQPGTTTSPYPNIRKSQLITNYLEIPLELRWTLKPEDPTRSVKLGVGGRIGWLYDSFSKVKYSENGETKKIKDKQDFDLNQIRYGLTGRIGFGNFSFFGYYNLSPLFKEGEGLQTDNVSNDFSTLTFGISLSSF